MSGPIFKLPQRVSREAALTNYHGDVILDKADPSGRDVLKFWNHDRYMSISEMLEEAKRASEEGK
jgi:hypothetical protein